MEMNIKTGAYIYNNKSYNFNFYTYLSAYDKLFFVNSVVDTLVDEKHYNSVARDLIFDFNIIKVFTDIDTSFVNVKDDDNNSINPIIFIEQFLEDTSVVDIVKTNMEIGLLEELNKAVDLDIQYLTGIHPNPLNEALTSLVNTLEQKISEVDLSSMMDMAKMFTGMTDSFTPENIVNAYIASDTHKKNLADIEESKKNKAEFAEDMDKAISSIGKKTKK